MNCPAQLITGDLVCSSGFKPHADAGGTLNSVTWALLYMRETSKEYKRDNSFDKNRIN